MNRRWIMVVAASFFIASSGLAFGATESCRFDVQLNELARARKKSEGADDAEFEIRKKILGEVIECASRDVQGLKDSLAAPAAKARDLELTEVQGRLNAELDEALAYYEGRRAVLDGLDLETSKNFSGGLLAWRTSTYEPLREHIANFLVWQRNENLIKTAEHRLLGVQGTFKALNLEGYEEIANLLQNAKTNFYYAQVSHRQARQAFVSHSAPNDAPYFIRSTLESLARTYRHFLELSAAAKKILAAP